jgi:hypothetical protein
LFDLFYHGKSYIVQSIVADSGSYRRRIICGVQNIPVKCKQMAKVARKNKITETAIPQNEEKEDRHKKNGTGIGKET